ncbi:hypothetical protein FB451DRAFT_1194935 [Mycena latifolia]|nr:hypothetical protein FB451DRAFT_1194935 [Mycena latifolia]
MPTHIGHSSLSKNSHLAPLHSGELSLSGSFLFGNLGTPIKEGPTSKRDLRHPFWTSADIFWVLPYLRLTSVKVPLPSWQVPASLPLAKFQQGERRRPAYEVLSAALQWRGRRAEEERQGWREGQPHVQERTRRRRTRRRYPYICIQTREEPPCADSREVLQSAARAYSEARDATGQPRAAQAQREVQPHEVHAYTGGNYSRAGTSVRGARFTREGPGGGRITAGGAARGQARARTHAYSVRRREVQQHEVQPEVRTEPRGEQRRINERLDWQPRAWGVSNATSRRTPALEDSAFDAHGPAAAREFPARA